MDMRTKIKQVKNKVLTIGNIEDLNNARLYGGGEFVVNGFDGSGGPGGITVIHDIIVDEINEVGLRFVNCKNLQIRLGKTYSKDMTNIEVGNGRYHIIRENCTNVQLVDFKFYGAHVGDFHDGGVDVLTRDSRGYGCHNIVNFGHKNFTSGAAAYNVCGEGSIRAGNVDPNQLARCERIHIENCQVTKIELVGDMSNDCWVKGCVADEMRATCVRNLKTGEVGIPICRFENNQIKIEDITSVAF